MRKVIKVNRGWEILKKRSVNCIAIDPVEVAETSVPSKRSKDDDEEAAIVPDIKVLDKDPVMDTSKHHRQEK